MTDNQLRRWKQDILSIFNADSLSSIEKRNAIESTIAKSLVTILKKPKIKANETYADYIKRRGGLPVRMHSPLLSYTPLQLRDKKTVPNCELNRLINWAGNVGQMLSIVENGTVRPIYQQKSYPKSDCPRASDNGKRIPFIDEINQQRLGDDDTYSYNHSIRHTRIYWVPQEFLP